MKFRTPLIVLIVALVCAPLCLAGGGMRPERAEHGMVASVHELASQAGVDMMKAGGNAIDAAVATGFALAVVHPTAGNIGGGGFMLIRMHDGATHFLDFREKAPGKATATMYQDAQGNVIPALSRVGYKAIGVPGSVKGMVYAQQHFGKLSLKQVMAPAIRLARDGFALKWGECALDDAGLRIGAVRGFEAHLSERRQGLETRRYLQTAGTGEDTGAHRRGAG